MSNFFQELKRRHIYRVAAAYVVVAWVLLQLFNNIAPILKMPDWVGVLVLVLLLGGLPVALLFAWVQDLGSADPQRKHAATGRLDWALFGALIIVIAMVSYQQIAPGVKTAGQQTGVELAHTAANAPKGLSVVVLPFENLSSDKEQEYFSDGMTEEITTALAKIPDLRVVARQSAFQYKGEKTDMRAVGQALNATHLITGSVRKAGERLRITAQLIKADDGVNIWADNYDRALTDVFAIQEDIARAIATSLRMPLGLKPGETLVSNRPKDQETYELYLKGVAALRSRTRQELDLLGQVVTRDPSFAPGWAMLAEAQREMGLFYQRLGEDEKRGPLLAQAESSARRAISLDPNLSTGYAPLAQILAERGKFIEAMELYDEGLSKNPDDAELLNNYSQTLRFLGYMQKSLVAKEHLALIEPLVPLFNRQRGELLLTLGMTDAGLGLFERLGPRDNTGLQLFLAMAYGYQGRFAEAANSLSQFLSGQRRLTPEDRRLLETAIRVLRSRADKTKPPTNLPEINFEANFVFAAAGTPERMLEWQEHSLKEEDYRPLEYVWWPTPASVRKTERFKTLVRKARLVDYWKARGWPDLCHPTTGDDFECN